MANGIPKAENRLNPNALRSNGYSINILDICEVDNSFISEWTHLEKRCIEPNIYLDSVFIFPALEYLSKNKKIKILVVNEYINGQQILRATGVFEEIKPFKMLPYKYLDAYMSPYSFLGGLLVDQSDPHAIIDAIYNYFISNSDKWCVVKFHEVPHDSIIIKKAHIDHRVVWYSTNSYERACIHISEKFLENPLCGVSKKRRKNTKRCFNLLSKVGAVRWKVISGAEAKYQLLSDFYRLEHAGWKGKMNSSFLSIAEHRKFLDDVFMRASKKGCLFFTELCLNDKVIAVTVNFLLQEKMFAFKVASDPEYDKYSPGILNEYKFLESYPECGLNIEFVDSGAYVGSFIERFWPDRYKIESGIIVTSRLAKYIAFLLIKVRRIRRIQRALFKSNSSK